MHRRVANGNKAAMLAAIADMRKAGLVMFDCSSTERIMLNDLVVVEGEVMFD
jgi:Leu/Phe-tRNA-protein transferase